MKTTLKLLLLVLPFILACTRVGRPPINQPSRPSAPVERPTPTENKPTPTVDLSGWEGELLQMVNNIRQKGCRCGRKVMPPVAQLSMDGNLTAAAQAHADDMYKNDFFDHTGSDGSDIGDRATENGFRWSAIGENISWNHPNVSATFNGWLNSKGHCMNMMSSSFRQMGAAKQGPYWVQTFGTSR